MLVTLLLALIAGSGSTTHDAKADDGISEEEVRFEGGDVTLHGTNLVPDAPGRTPAMALVHGSGPGPRELRRPDADAFTRRSIVTLIYDKRTEGYSDSGLGERSYELLAQDALAAVRTLRAHPEVDRDAVGLWGRSEGGWVVPLAANRSEEVAFVVLVGASGVSPARQVSWFLEGQLRHLGVTGSMVEAVSRTGIRVQLGAIVLPALTFASCLAVAFGAALARHVRGRLYEAPEATTSRVRRGALWLASAGLATILGFICYFGLLIVTAASMVGPIAAGRLIPWLALETLSVATCAFTVLLAASWQSSLKVLVGADRVRTGILLAGGTVFAAWAAYWGLLSP